MFRGIVFAYCDSAPIIVAAQILDGISSGILDVLIPLILADMVGGTGHYSMSRGLISTVQGVGGSLSNIAAGTMVAWGGYGAAFSVLTLVAPARFASLFSLCRKLTKIVNTPSQKNPFGSA